MNVFIETTAHDLFIAIYDQDYKLVKFKHEEKLIQKVEQIPYTFFYLLNQIEKSIKDVKNIYLNLGPGTFTGSRIGLVFARTICQVSNIKLWTTNTFSLIAHKSLKKQLVNVDARGNKMFQAYVQKGLLKSEIIVLEKDVIQKIDYENLKNNFSSYLHIFELQQNLLKVTPFYGKEPQIGGH